MLRESATVEEGRGSKGNKGVQLQFGEGERGVAVPFRVHIVILAPDAQQSK